MGYPTHTPLGETGFRAYVGPSRYEDEDNEDWDYYSISVQKQHGKSSYVFFQRDFKMDEVPADIVGKKAESIVTYDKESRLVKFMIGSKTHSYTLPKR